MVIPSQASFYNLRIAKWGDSKIWTILKFLKKTFLKIEIFIILFIILMNKILTKLVSYDNILLETPSICTYLRVGMGTLGGLNRHGGVSKSRYCPSNLEELVLLVSGISWLFRRLVMWSSFFLINTTSPPFISKRLQLIR